MKRILVLAALLLLTALPSHAQFAGSPPPAAAGGPVAVGQAQAQAQVDPNSGKVAIVVAPPNPAEASISFGTLGGQLLTWAALLFGGVIATFVVKWVQALAKKAGVDVSQAQSDKLNAMLENSIHLAAQKAETKLDGTMTVEVKNKVVADAVQYAKEHGADTIKDLAGVDPNDPKIQEALKARAAKALATVSPDAVLAPAASPAA